MNKRDLINEIAQRTGYSQVLVEQIISPIFQCVKDALLKGEKISISNFGTLFVKKMDKRKAINPATGEKITVKAKKVVRFKQSPTLLEKEK